jgi:hypothetical protein
MRTPPDRRKQDCRAAAGDGLSLAPAAINARVTISLFI